MTSTDPTKAIQTLLETVRTKEKWLIPQLRPPATADALQSLRALDAPSLMVALYAMHDGTEHELLGSFQLLSIEAILAERQRMQEVFPAENGPWNSKWIPFLADGDGQLYCVDPAGTLDLGAPGQIIFYDHEAGPKREFMSFEVFISLVTSLANAKLLDQEAQEAKAEKYEGLYTDAKYLGLPKMPAKERKAALAKVDEPSALSKEQQLDLLLPLVRQYPTEGELWGEIAYAAAELERWPLLIEAASTANRFAPKGYADLYTEPLVVGLHRLGRDDDALAALRTAFARIKNPHNERPTNLVSTNADAAFRLRALALMTEVFPAYFEGWFLLGSESTEITERTRCFKEVIRVVNASKNPNGAEERRRFEADRLLVHQDLESVSHEERADGLMAFAKRVDRDTIDAIAWREAAAQALAVDRWEQAASAAAKAAKKSSSDNKERYETCRITLRALYELGKENQALTALKKTYADGYMESDRDCFAAIPWHEERLANIVTRDPAALLFEVKCFALVTKLDPENFDAWKHRASLETGPELKTVLKNLVACCENALELEAETIRASNDGQGYYESEDIEEFVRAKAEALQKLSKPI